jgi:hypothetical protein
VRRGQTPTAVQGAVPRIQRDFERLLSQELTPAELVTGGGKRSTWSDRPTPNIATEINVDNRVSANQSVIEVTTKEPSKCASSPWLRTSRKQRKHELPSFS